MIDTIILAIPRDKITTIKDDSCKFPIWMPQGKKIGFEKWIKNPFKNNLHYPRLTGIKRKIGITEISTVNIEFSIPKLLFQNNLDEVSESDFINVIDTLQRFLREMGEIITKDDLINAKVITFHPAKNILLSDGYTVHGIIKELGKINITKKFELTKVIFKNEGQALQIYSLSNSLVFYDKISDMNKSKKKAIDRLQTPMQFTLFEEIKNRRVPVEVLRIEVRFNNKVKLNSVFKKLDIKANLIFFEIFKKDTCQKIVKWYWDTMIKEENLFLFELSNNPKQLLKDILNNPKKIKVMNALSIVGLSVLSKDGDGIRELRSIIEKRIKQRNWYQISQKFKLLNEITKGKSLHSWVKQVDDSIKIFDTYKINSNSP